MVTPRFEQSLQPLWLVHDLEGAVVTTFRVAFNARPADLTDPSKTERGGLSGKPLFRRSTELLRRVYSLTNGKIPLIGVGGVVSGADAYAKIRAGASLVQLYTALVYAGPSLLVRIKRDLATLLRRDGFTRLTDAIGADHKSNNPAKEKHPE